MDLTERNANHIIPLYCYLLVSCRGLVDRCGSPGSCKPQIKFNFLIINNNNNNYYYYYYYAPSCNYHTLRFSTCSTNLCEWCSLNSVTSCFRSCRVCLSIQDQPDCIKICLLHMRWCSGHFCTVRLHVEQDRIVMESGMGWSRVALCILAILICWFAIRTHLLHGVSAKCCINSYGSMILLLQQAIEVTTNNYISFVEKGNKNNEIGQLVPGN